MDLDVTNDPNENYEVAPIPPGDLMHSHGWWQCTRNGAMQWIGPEDRMRELATDAETRKEDRCGKKHHDKKPT